MLAWTADTPEACSVGTNIKQCLPAKLPGMQLIYLGSMTGPQDSSDYQTM